MPKIRKFLKLTEEDKLSALFNCIVMSHDEMARIKTRTDIIGIAIQFGKPFGLKKSDFKLLEPKLKEIITIINKY